MSKSPRIVCAVNYVPKFQDPIKQERQKVAMEVLAENKPDNVEVVSFNFVDEAIEDSNLPSCFRVLKMLKRDSKKEIGNNRKLPYVTELFDCASQVRGCEVFGVINSDILLHKDFFKIFDKKTDAWIFYRYEITKVTVRQFNNKEYRIIWDEHSGNDGFFFNKKWWLHNRDKFYQNAVWGETEHDTVSRYLIKYLTKNHVVKRALYHVYHDAKWTLTSPGAINNINIWNDLKERLKIIV